jgi:hypothetical protein
MDLRFKFCPKCAAIIAVGLISHLCVAEEIVADRSGAPAAVFMPFGSNYHTPHQEPRWAIIEPTVAQVTSSNMTVTPGTGTLSLSNGVYITPNSGGVYVVGSAPFQTRAAGSLVSLRAL